MKMEPRELSVSEKDGGKISIIWSDGHSSVYHSFNVRAACPCAMCKGEPGIFGKHFDPPKIVVEPNVQPKEIGPVGRYGLKISWTDGHDLGIYTFDYLRKLCECDECSRERRKKS